MKKVVLAMLVVLTVSTVSFGGWIPTVREIDNGNPYLITYIVGLQVDDIGGITSISDISITGEIVQVWFDQGGNKVKTVIEGQMPTQAQVPEMIFDTHLLNLASYGTGVQAAGDGWTESNDASNPGGLSGNGLQFGIGDLVLANDPSTLAIKNPVEGLNAIEFAQVVFPVGGMCSISGLYTNAIDAEAGVPMIPFCLMSAIPDDEDPINEPEPSTIALLVVGALCLVGTRLRRK